MIRTDYNPKHYRFPRTWRDSNGGENLAPLPARVTFHTHQPLRLRYVLILVAVVVCFLAGWGVRLRYVLILVAVVVCFLAGWGVR